MRKLSPTYHSGIRSQHQERAALNCQAWATRVTQNPAGGPFGSINCVVALGVGWRKVEARNSGQTDYCLGRKVSQGHCDSCSTRFTPGPPGDTDGSILVMKRELVSLKGWRTPDVKDKLSPPNVSGTDPSKEDPPLKGQRGGQSLPHRKGWQMVDWQAA